MGIRRLNINDSDIKGLKYKEEKLLVETNKL